MLVKIIGKEGEDAIGVSVIVSKGR